MSKIIESYWWTLKTGETMGIVVIQPEVGERKAYMGKGNGVSEKADARLIAEYGVPIYPAQLAEILYTLRPHKPSKAGKETDFLFDLAGKIRYGIGVLKKDDREIADALSVWMVGQKAKTAIMIKNALLTDGGHHKQWYLEQIAKEQGIDLSDIKGSYEKGIAP